MFEQPTLMQLIRSDIAAWGDLWLGKAAGATRTYGLMTSVRLICTHLGLRAAILYRVSAALHRRRVKMLPQVVARLNAMLHGLDIPSSVEIGPRLYIPHPVGTVVMAERIGSGVTLVSGVTIGMRHEQAFPRIGDNVYIGAGARVLGDIIVGNNVSIGANAVVLQDVPDHSVAVGVPARVLPDRSQARSRITEQVNGRVSCHLPASAQRSRSRS